MGSPARAWCTCTCRLAVINSFLHFGAPYSEDRMSMHPSVTELWIKTLGHAYIRICVHQLTAPECNLRYILTNVRLYSLRFWRTVAYKPMPFPTCMFSFTNFIMCLFSPTNFFLFEFYAYEPYLIRTFSATNLSPYEHNLMRTLSSTNLFIRTSPYEPFPLRIFPLRI